MCSFRVLLVICVFAGSVMSAGAQEPPFANGAPGQAVDDLQNWRFSLKARGDGTTVSTVGSILEDISLAHPRVQFVVEPAAANIPLPALEFRQLRLKAVLRLIEHVSGGRIRLDDNSITFEPGDESIVVLVGAQEVEQKVVKVLSVRHLLTEEVEEQDLMDAIEAGFAFLGGESKPEIRFHQKTGLVFIRGTLSEVAFIAQLVAAMSGSAGFPEGLLSRPMMSPGMSPGNLTVPGERMMGGSTPNVPVSTNNAETFFPDKARNFLRGEQVPAKRKVVTGEPVGGPQAAPPPQK